MSNVQYQLSSTAVSVYSPYKYKGVSSCSASNLCDVRDYLSTSSFRATAPEQECHPTATVLHIQKLGVDDAAAYLHYCRHTSAMPEQ
jgi:hypothetical protein